MSRILVTGASGELGRMVVEHLLDLIPASSVVALARDISKITPLIDRGVEARIGDYCDPVSLVNAFDGIDKVLLVSALAFTDVVAQHTNVIDAAERAGVKHLHYTAIQHQAGSSFEIPQVTEWDRATEQRLAACPLAVTILRNPFYLDLLPTLFGKDVLTSGIRVPAGHGKAALATRADLAEATAKVLSTDGHEGKAYSLGGSDAPTVGDMASAIGDAVGTEVRYHDISVSEYVADKLVAGFDRPWAVFSASWFEAIAAGEFETEGVDLERLLERPPESVRDFLSAHYRTETKANFPEGAGVRP